MDQILDIFQGNTLGSEALLVAGALLLLAGLGAAQLAELLPWMGWRQLSSRAGQESAVARLAERRYGRNLRAAGFHRVASLTSRNLLGLPKAADNWAQSSSRTFATISERGVLTVSNYFFFRDGWMVLETDNRRGLKQRKPGAWRSHRPGGLPAELIEVQKRQVQEFLSTCDSLWIRLSDLTPEAKLSAEEAFERSAARPRLLKLRLAAGSLIACALVGLAGPALAHPAGALAAKALLAIRLP